MLLQINFKSGKPVYLQVVDQIKAATAAGTLQAGEALPSIRPLAEELRLNRNTIAKAYSELENQGVIENLPGKGCFVRPNNSPLNALSRIDGSRASSSAAVSACRRFNVAIIIILPPRRVPDS